MESDITVGVLGPVVATSRGRPLTIPGRKPKLVLARLALAVPRVVTADELIDTVWGDAPPDTARKTLQKYISDLRKALGDGALATEGAGYRLVIDPAGVDALRFEAVVEEMRRNRMHRLPVVTTELADDAMAMWRGRPFADVDDVAFTADETRRLEELRLTIEEEQLAAHIETGDIDVVSRLEELTGAYPHRERFWGLLMTALYQAGRQADALATFRRLRSILGEGLGLEPSAELVELEDRILMHDPSLRGRGQRTSGNLPVPHTSLVGRDQDLARAVAILDGARLITFTGAGGSGKTRLAIEVGERVRTRFPDGVWFADLTSVTSPGRVAPAVATALGLAQEPTTPVDRLLEEHIENRRLLIILDNAEHVLGEVATVARRLVYAARGVTVLTTSREPLGLTGEVVVGVSSLAVPERSVVEPHLLREYPSIELFSARGAAAHPSFELSEAEVPIVAEICRLLDGIPLALELAARQLHVLDVAELRDGLQTNPGLLAAPGEPDARHRTMEAAIGWSYRLLDAADRALFEAVGVFAGSFTEAAALAVWASAGLGGSSDSLRRLVARSMVSHRRTEAGGRFRLLEPIRAFARARLQESDREAAASYAYATWLLALLAANENVVGPQERETLESLSEEYHHVPVVLDWALEHDVDLAYRILIAATQFVSMIVYRFSWAEDLVRAIAYAEEVSEDLRAAALARCAFMLSENFADFASAHEWAERALDLVGEGSGTETEAFAQLGLGLAKRNAGALTEAHRRVELSVGLFDRLGPPAWAARARHVVAYLALPMGRYEYASEMADAALAIWRVLGSEWGEAKAHWLKSAAAAMTGDYETAEKEAVVAHRLFALFFDPGSPVHVRAAQGDAARLGGKLEQAETIYLECLDGFHEVGDRRCVASTLRNLGYTTLALDRLDEARGYLGAAMERRRRLSDEGGVAECLEGFGLVALRLGAHDVGVRLLAASEAYRGSAGAVAPLPEQEAVSAALDHSRDALGSGKFEDAWHSGSKLSTGDAVALASSLSEEISTNYR